MKNTMAEDFLDATPTTTIIPPATNTSKEVVNQFSQKELMQKYIASGFYVFPLNGKIPTKEGTGFQLKKSTDATATAKGNYGIAMTTTDMVIDIDPRHGGTQSFARLLTDLQIKEPKSFVVRTGGGGWHYYLKKPSSLAIRKTVKEYPGIEFISQGGYVVGPWSMHPTTQKPYTILKGSLDHIMYCPEEILSLLRKDKQLVSEKTNTNQIENIQDRMRYISYLESTAPVAVQGETGDNTTFLVSAKGKDFGLSKDQIIECLLLHWNERCFPPWTEDELTVKVSNAFSYGKNLPSLLAPSTVFAPLDVEEHDETIYSPGKFIMKGGKVENGSLVNTMQYLVTMPEIKNLIRFNEFTQDIEFSRVAPWHADGFHMKWTDLDDFHLLHYLEHKYGFKAGELNISKAVSLAAHINKFHPVKKFIESTLWDGKPRVDTWLTEYLGVYPSPYVAEIGRLTLFGAIHRIYSPGCKFDYMLVLEGKTGIGKSSVIEILGNQWYSSGNLDFHNKDTVDMLRGKWIIEMAEMDNMRRQEVSAAKAFITRQVDRARLAFAKRTVDFPRQCIFIGTINPNAYGYLKDDTGNRRYWPVVCHPEEGKPIMRLGALSKDVSQLWAEALYLCQKDPGRLYIKDKEVNAQAEEEQEARRPQDELAPLIADWAKRNKIKEARSITIWLDALRGEPMKFNRAEQMRLATLLRSDLRWESKVVWKGGEAKRLWFPPGEDDFLN